MQISKIRWLAILGAAVFALPLAAAREVLVVGSEFSKVFEPREGGAFIGLGVDVVRSLALKSGDTVRLEIYPWARAQMMVETGLADVLLGPYKTPERTLCFTFAERPFFQDQMRLYARKTGTPFVWNGDITTLKSIRIVSVHGWTYGEAFDRVETTKVYALKDAILMLTREHADLLAANARDVDGQLLSLPLANSLVPLEPVISTQNAYLAFHKSSMHDALRVQWDRAMDSLVAKGGLAKLAHKYQLKAP